jgi:hypothetical protein
MDLLMTLTKSLLLLTMALCSAAAQAQLPMLDEKGRELHMRPLPKAGGWDITLHSRDAQHRQPVFCRAERHFGSENWLALAFSSTETHVDFSGDGSATVGRQVKVNLGIDNEKPDDYFQTAVFTGPAGVEWLRITGSRLEVGNEDAFAHGNRLWIQAGKQRWTYSLAGSSAAFKALVACEEKFITR